MEIKEKYLEFFKSKGHKVIPSAPVIPENDPTCLFITAGMQPLIPYLKGQKHPDGVRLVDVQKCFRTNDLDSVGDTYHHTFFEMLGNFSVGDYFKDEAIEMAFELLTNEKYFGFPLEKLYITVYKNDDEAYDKWIKMGVDPTHLVRLESNFWEIGEGPCGPDSEIFYDRGIEYDKDNLGIKLLQDEIDNSRYVEIWNNVFMQYERKEDGSLVVLPKKNVDTGMGLERITAVLEGVNDNYESSIWKGTIKKIDTGMGLERMACIIEGVESSYDTDLFRKIINKIEELSNKKYNNDKEFRIIADHIRTLTFAIADGAVFSNEGRGYVIRRLLRRSVRYGHDIGIPGKFMSDIVPSVVETMKNYYPELETKKEYIQGIIDKEEELFQKTLVSGEKKLNEMLEKTENKTLSGTDAFKLYDTYGFPYELTEEYLKEKGYTVDKYEFDTCMNNQKEMARKSRKKEASMNIQNEALLNFKEESKFTGYEDYQTDTEVIALIKDGKLVDELTDTGYVILKETPFYAEMGGQVSDTGYIYNDSLKVLVEDLFISPNKEHVHIVNVEEGVIHVHDKVTARINVKRRNAIEKNHSATHLLHQALKEALDYEVLQAGSKVTEKELRILDNVMEIIESKDSLELYRKPIDSNENFKYVLDILSFDSEINLYS